MNNYIETLAKIKIIDRTISSMSLDEVKEQFGHAITVDKLEGIESPAGPLLNACLAVSEHRNDIGMLRDELFSIKNELVMVKCDLIVAIRVITDISRALAVTNSADLQALKSKYGIY